MEALPDLDRLSVAEKDDLIRAIFAQVETLLSKVAELEGRLAKNSRNSSTPPPRMGSGRSRNRSAKRARSPRAARRGTPVTR